MPTSQDRPDDTARTAPVPDHPAVPDHLAVLPDLQARFAGTLRTADLTAPVPACGDWTVTELALHLGAVHRWAAGMARGEARDDVEPTEPREREPLLDFYQVQAAELVATLRRIGPDHPAVTLVGPGPASFWHRRQVHETLVHLHDLCAAAGAPLTIDDPVLWADTVDEVVTMMTPRQVRLGRITPAALPVLLHADDAARTWHLDQDPAPEQPAATISGPARVLALLLWRRSTLDDTRLTVTGNRDAATTALARPLTP